MSRITTNVGVLQAYILIHISDVGVQIVQLIQNKKKELIRNRINQNAYAFKDMIIHTSYVGNLTVPTMIMLMVIQNQINNYVHAKPMPIPIHTLDVVNLIVPTMIMLMVFPNQINNYVHARLMPIPIHIMVVVLLIVQISCITMDFHRAR